MGSVRPKICNVSSNAVREIWKVSGGVASSSSESAEEGGMGGAWKLKAVKSDLSRKAEATRGCQCERLTSQVQADAPSMTLASSTENFRPSSLSMTCALGANAMQRRSVNSWRAELDTAVRTGGSSCMVGVVGRECGGRERFEGSKSYCIPIDYNARPGYQGTKRRRRLRRSCTLRRTWGC